MPSPQNCGRKSVRGLSLIFVRYQNRNFWSFPILLDWLRTGAMDSFGEAHEFAGMI
jgi:hypothetical protein